MQANVWRLFQRGEALDRAWVRRSTPARGELALRLRLEGRGSRDAVYLACLMADDCAYVIPALDDARLVELRGRWLRLPGTEVIPSGRSMKRIPTTRYRQEWWCRVEGAT